MISLIRHDQDIMNTPFSHAQFALLTLHGKEKIIRPHVETHLGATLVLNQDFNTDSLGTFGGEVERELSPIECAITKAKLACSLTGLDYGLGSEGSFLPSNYGFGTANHELIACVNPRQGWSVVGHYYGFSNARQKIIANATELFQFVAKTPAGQGLILSCPAGIAKGLYGIDEIESTLREWFGQYALLGSAFSAKLTIGDDLRANHCPERREHIHKAMENLTARLLAACPHCGVPGFWPDKTHTGLPCRFCGNPTAKIRARTAHCTQCHCEQTYPCTEAAADPGLCGFCNP